MNGNVVSVQRTIPAPAAKIFALLVDPARHLDFDGSGTVRGTPPSAGATPLTRVGDTFSMSMRQGLPYRMINRVVEFEQDRRIAWSPYLDVPVIGSVIGGRVWRYVLEPKGDSTVVTESWDVSGEVLRPLVKVGGMPAKTEANMARTLERIEQLLS